MKITFWSLELLFTFSPPDTLSYLETQTHIYATGYLAAVNSNLCSAFALTVKQKKKHMNRKSFFLQLNKIYNWMKKMAAHGQSKRFCIDEQVEGQRER